MCENTARFQASRRSLHNVWKYNKIAGNRGKFQLLKPPVIWPCVKIQQDSRQATHSCAMCEDTTGLQATGGNLNDWSHQLSGHVWEYSKIPGKPPIVVQCVKIQQDCRQREKIEVIEATTCENTTRFQATTRLQAMGETFRLLTPPDILHCLRPQQDCRQQGKISIIEATNELAMFENRTRLQATGGNINYWSHQISGHVRVPQDSRQATNSCAMCENTTGLQATGDNWSYWSHRV